MGSRCWSWLGTQYLRWVLEYSHPDGFYNESDIYRIGNWQEILEESSGNKLGFYIIKIFPELIQGNELELNIEGWVEYD